MYPSHGRRPGRFVHPTPDVALVPTGRALPARTMAPSCKASRLAGPGAPSGMSKKWRRSQTNTRPKVAAPRGENPRSASGVIVAVATTEGVPTWPGNTCSDTPSALPRAALTLPYLGSRQRPVRGQSIGWTMKNS